MERTYQLALKKSASFFPRKRDYAPTIQTNIQYFIVIPKQRDRLSRLEKTRGNRAFQRPKNICFRRLTRTTKQLELVSNGYAIYYI